MSSLEAESPSPPPWHPKRDPLSEYAFDLIPIDPDVRVRVTLGSEVAPMLARAARALESGLVVRAVRAPQEDLGIVILEVDGETFRVGRLPDGYEHPVDEAHKRYGSVPISLWAVEGGGYVLDLRTGLAR